jgi:hypothetical protein
MHSICPLAVTLVSTRLQEHEERFKKLNIVISPKASCIKETINGFKH